MRGLLALGVASAVALWGSEAVTATSIEVSLEYDAAPACEAEEAFIERLRARAPGLRLASDGQALRVTIRPGTKGFVGTVRLGDDVQSPGRTLEAARCTEVVDACALAASIALEERERAAQQTSPPPRPTPAAMITAAAVRSPATVLAERRDPALDWVFAAGPEARVGVTPSPAAGGEIAAAVRLESALQPSVELALAYAYQPPASVPGGGAATFALYAGRLVPCLTPLQWRSLAARACAAFELGLLEGHGADVTRPASAGLLWIGAGGAAHIVFTLTARVALVAKIGAEIPVRQATFAFDVPAHDVWRVAPTTGYGMLDVEMRIP